MALDRKLFIAAAAALALGLLLGFWPVHADTVFSSVDCGSAFFSNAGDFNLTGQELCDGKISTMRYPSLILVIGGLIATVIAFTVRENSTWSPASR